MLSAAPTINMPLPTALLERDPRLRVTLKLTHFGLNMPISVVLDLGLYDLEGIKDAASDF